MLISRSDSHKVDRIGWLRAAVLGANDGLVSTASLVVGVASAGSGTREILIAGTAGLAAGAMSMAAGEYVSVSSQADAEKAEAELESRHLARDTKGELEELTKIYVDRGLDQGLASRVAEQLTEADALGTHLRDELGITDTARARPLQAGAVSALCFAAGATPPILIAATVPQADVRLWVMAGTLATLAVLGAVGAMIGGASPVKGAVRVCFWGALAMLATAAVGSLFGLAV